MIRKQVYILPQQDDMLKEAVAKYGVSEGELIRAALSKHLPQAEIASSAPDYNAWRQELAFINSRAVAARTTKSDTEHPRRWRREDLYER